MVSVARAVLQPSLSLWADYSHPLKWGAATYLDWATALFLMISLLSHTLKHRHDTMSPFLRVTILSWCNSHTIIRPLFFFFFFFSFIFISWGLITLQHCNGFCHTLTWISHGFTSLLPPSPTHPSGSSQCTSPKHLTRPLFKVYSSLLSIFT